MNRLNNKGFLLVETLITTCIIAILATSLYVYVSKTADNYEKRDSYDNIVDVYKLSNVKKWLEDNWDDSTYKPTGGCKYNILNNIPYAIRDSIDLKDLNICVGNYKSHFDQLHPTNGATYNYAYREYVRLLPALEDDEYIVLARFEKNNNHTFASLKIKVGA